MDCGGKCSTIKALPLALGRASGGGPAITVMLTSSIRSATRSSARTTGLPRRAPSNKLVVWLDASGKGRGNGVTSMGTRPAARGGMTNGDVRLLAGSTAPTGMTTSRGSLVTMSNPLVKTVVFGLAAGLPPCEGRRRRAALPPTVRLTRHVKSKRTVTMGN